LKPRQCLPGFQIPHPNAGIIYLPAPIIPATREDKAAVMGYSDAVDIGLMPLQALQFSPRYGVPDPHGFIPASRQDSALRRKGYRGHIGRVALETADLLAGSQVPEMDDLARMSKDSCAAIGGGGDANNPRLFVS